MQISTSIPGIIFLGDTRYNWLWILPSFLFVETVDDEVLIRLMRQTEVRWSREWIRQPWRRENLWRESQKEGNSIDAA